MHLSPLSACVGAPPMWGSTGRRSCRTVRLEPETKADLRPGVRRLGGRIMELDIEREDRPHGDGARRRNWRRWLSATAVAAAVMAVLAAVNLLPGGTLLGGGAPQQNSAPHT